MENRGFKKKTIIANIREKMDAWIKTLPEDLQGPVKGNYIITGGAIASMLMGELPNDYDVYFQNVEVLAKLVNYYLSTVMKTDLVSRVEAKVEPQRVRIVIKSAGIADGDDANFDNYEYFEMTDGSTIDDFLDGRKMNTKQPYRPVMITDNAISLTEDIQIITRFVGTPEEVHKTFDYVHATNWFTECGGLHLNQPALESILAKELKYIGSLYPVCTMFRMKKFLQRGWTITAGEMLKIAYDIGHLDLDDYSVLREQLIGVDTAYFNQILRILSKEGSRELDRIYLAELINRVFDGD